MLNWGALHHRQMHYWRLECEMLDQGALHHRQLHCSRPNWTRPNPLPFEVHCNLLHKLQSCLEYYVYRDSGGKNHHTQASQGLGLNMVGHLLKCDLHLNGFAHPSSTLFRSNHFNGMYKVITAKQGQYADQGLKHLRNQTKLYCTLLVTPPVVTTAGGFSGCRIGNCP